MTAASCESVDLSFTEDGSREGSPMTAAAGPRPKEASG